MGVKMGWIQIKMGHPLARNGAALAPFRANGAHPSYIVKPNTYLGRAKERWMQSLASESLLRAFCKLHLSAHARGRTYVFTEHAHH